MNIFLNRDVWRDVKVELDLSNYTTKADLETQQVLMIHRNLQKKVDLASLKLIN